MTYKNGFKEYFLTTVFFGVPMGLFYSFSSSKLLIGIIIGILCGVLFSLFMFLFMKFQERKFAKKKEEIAKETNIICDGVATIQGNGGWMFLTERGIEFYPHKINFSTKEIKILTDMISAVNAQKNLIVITTADNLKFDFVVSHNKEWLGQIEKAMAELK